MAYISKFSGEEIDTLLTNSNIISELESDMDNLSTSIENSLSSIDTEIANLKSADESLITRMTNAETQLNNKAPSYTYSTTDLTAGSSSLTTGKLYIVYE